jgi:hypothetical protein
MNIPAKHRRWLLGAALLLAVAAAASVDKQDGNESQVVLANPSRIHVQQQSEHPAVAEPSADILMGKLKRPVLPENAKDMFASKSWYVPPPVINLPPPPPSAPPLPFVFVGKMLEPGKSSTVFLEMQNRIFVVREGDAIDSIYRVDTISPPEMTLTYLPLDIKQTVQIGEAN